MKKFTHHLFYRIYWWNTKIVKDDKSLAPFSTLLGTSLLKVLNLVSLLYLINRYLIQESLFIPKWLQTIIFLLVIMFDYFNYLYNSKYKSIIKETKDLSKSELKKRDHIVVYYIAITFILLIWIITKNFNH